MDERVFFAAAPDYSQDTVDAAVERLLQQLPAAALLAPGKKVLLKPNLLSGTAPEKAVTTHPAAVTAVIRAAKRRGVAASDITVADSPGGPHASGLVKSAWKASGLAAVCAEEGVRLCTGAASGEAPKTEGAKRRFTLLEPVLAADVIIDLPKCKTHMMTGLSAATKNLFGCIPGLQKAEWHMRCPKKEDFGDMLVDLLLTVKPCWTAWWATRATAPAAAAPGPWALWRRRKTFCPWTWPSALCWALRRKACPTLRRPKGGAFAPPPSTRLWRQGRGRCSRRWKIFACRTPGAR